MRHLMSHTSGVAGWDQPVTVADILDPMASVERLAAQAPWWEPGSASGYHGINQGHLIGEVVRRITGRSLGTFFADEIAGPLGADFHIGLDPQHDGRVATVIPPPPMEFDLDSMDQTSPGFRFFVGPVIDPSVCNTPEWRRAEIGAAGGQGNARSVARIQSVVVARWRGRWREVALAVDDRPDLRRAEQRSRPVSRHPASLRHRLRARSTPRTSRTSPIRTCASGVAGEARWSSTTSSGA